MSHQKVSHQNVLQSMPFGVLQVDTFGQIVYVNKSALKLLGFISESDVLGRNYKSLDLKYFEKGGKELQEDQYALHIALNKKKAVNSVIQGVLFDHKKRWFSFNTSPLFNDDGELIGAVSNFTDVTEEVQEAERKQLDAERYKVLVENLNAVVWESRYGTETFSYVSPKAADLLGFPREAWFEEEFWQSRLFEEDKERVLAYEKHKLPYADSYQLEYRLVHEDGSLIWVKDLVKVVKSDGVPTKLRGLIIDITERKKSQSLLRSSQKRYKQMIFEAPYGISIYDRDGTLIAANSKVEEYWMMDLKSGIGELNLFQSETFTEEWQKKEIAKAFKGERGEVTAKFPLIHAENTERTYQIKYYPLFDSEGELENVVYFTEDITKSVQAEEKVRQEESLKQGILDALDEAILVIDEAGLIININRNFKEYVKDHFEKEVNEGDSVFDYASYLSDHDYLEDSVNTILNKKAKVLNHEMHLADGRWYNLRITPLEEPFGAVLAWQDIHARKEVDVALEKSLKKYRNTYNRAPVMMHSINEQMEVISVSDYWLDKMGYERHEVIGQKIMRFMTNSSIEALRENMKIFYEQGGVKNVEYEFIKKSGETISVLLSSVAEYDDEGVFERSITGMIDVTTLKNTELKLQESQDRLLESQRLSKIASYEYDIVTENFILSEEMTAMLNLDSDMISMSDFKQLIHEDDRVGFSKKVSKSIKKEHDFFYLFRILHSTSEQIQWVSARGTIEEENGNAIRMLGTIQDITEQKYIEQKIKRLSDRALLATEIANLGVWEYDIESDKVFWEDQMYQIFSDASEPLSLEGLKKYLVGEDKENLIDMFTAVRKGANFSELDICIHVGGEEKYLRVFTRLLRDHNDKPKGMLGVVYDITTDKKLTMELESSLEEKNVLVKEVHHRVKNNMQLISSILALKSYDLKDDLSRQVFDEVNNRIKAMSIIHDKLYNFYNVSEVDVSEYLSHIASELQILQGTSSIQIEVHAEEIIMDVDKALVIGLMVSEMVGNAIKHGYHENEEGAILVHLFRKKKQHTLRVINDGEKMTEDILKSHSGLGMSLIKTFVKQLEGEVSLDAENGFRVCF